MLVLIFCCHLLGVCVFGVRPMFPGFMECAGDGFLGIIDLILLQTEGN